MTSPDLHDWLLAALAAAAFCVSGDGRAGSLWVAPGDGLWENGANWSTATPPLATDLVEIVTDATVTSSAPGNVAQELYTDSTLEVIAGDLTLTGTLTNAQRLEVTGGALASAWQLQNHVHGYTLVRAANGALSILSVTGHTQNDGELVIQANGRFDTQSLVSTGNIDVRFTGRLEADHFVSTAGGVTVSEGSLRVGHAFAADSTVLAQGGGLLEAESIEISDGLTIENAGSIARATSALNHALGTIVVRDSGLLELSGNLTNDGTLHADGGRVSAGSADNKASLDLRAGATLDAGSLINAGGADLTITDAVTALNVTGNLTNLGTLAAGARSTLLAGSIDNHASFITAGGADAGADSLRNDGTVSVTGLLSELHLTDALINTGDMVVADHGRLAADTLVQTAGSLTLDNGHIVATTVLSGGTLRGSGSLTGQTLVIDDAVLSPGLAPGDTAAFDVLGDFALTGTALFEIGGLGLDAYDRVAASGSVYLDNILEITLIAGFNPALGDFFDVFSGADVGLVNPSLWLPTLGAGLSWSYGVVNAGLGAASFRLAVVPVPASAWLLLPAVIVLLQRRN